MGAVNELATPPESPEEFRQRVAESGERLNRGGRIGLTSFALSFVVGGIPYALSAEHTPVGMAVKVLAAAMFVYGAFWPAINEIIYELRHPAGPETKWNKLRNN